MRANTHMRLYGVLVGIDHYRDARINDLAWSGSDARALHALVQNGTHALDRVTHLFIDANATKLAILKVVGEDIARLAEEDDFVLLFFAGHGSPETCSRGCIRDGSSCFWTAF